MPNWYVKGVAFWVLEVICFMVVLMRQDYPELVVTLAEAGMITVYFIGCLYWITLGSSSLGRQLRADQLRESIKRLEEWK